jgi:hypothetical protein
MLVTVGPEYTPQLPPANLTTPGMYILPFMGHYYKGTLVGFRVDVVSEGYLEIKVNISLRLPSINRYLVKRDGRSDRRLDRSKVEINKNCFRDFLNFHLSRSFFL